MALGYHRLMFVTRYVSLVCAAVLSSACTPSVTPEKVQQIKVCSTTYKEVKALVGSPSKIGKIGGHPTWTYNNAFNDDPPPKLIILYDGDVVSDLAYNPPGIVELKSRCQGEER